MSKDCKITQKCYQVTIIRYLDEDYERELIDHLKKDESIGNVSNELSKNFELLALVQFLREFDSLRHDFKCIGPNLVSFIESLKFKKIEWDFRIRIHVEVVLTEYVKEQEFIDEFQRCFYDKGNMPGNFQVKLHGDELP